jgi:hypothetical protein
VSRDTPEIGIAELAAAIDVLVDARAKDAFGSDVYGSSILWDAASFLAKVEEPENIFISPAKQTALRLAGRILRFEGWNAVDGYFSTWHREAEMVDPTGPRVARVAAYVALFKKYWEPNGVPFLDVFDQYEEP